MGGILTYVVWNSITHVEISEVVVIIYFAETPTALAPPPAPAAYD